MASDTERKKEAERLAHKSLRSLLCHRFLTDYGFQNGRAIVPVIVDDILQLFAAYYPERQEPGTIIYTAAHKDATAARGRTMQDTPMQAVRLTMVDPQDAELFGQGPTKLLLTRLKRWTREALDQGALLTTADLAYLSGRAQRNVELNIARYEQEHHTLLPLRGTVHDCSGKLTHKAQIVSLYLEGHLPPEIARQTNHSLEAVERYLHDFETVRMLIHMDIDHISRIMGRSKAVIRQYLNLLDQDQARKKGHPGS